jgi:hypothetical protein
LVGYPFAEYASYNTQKNKAKIEMFGEETGID